jgi:hypothetical protein
MVDHRQLLILDDLDDENRLKWLQYWSSHNHAAWRQHPACGELAKSCGETPIFVIGLVNNEVGLVGVFSMHSLGFGLIEAVCLRGPVFEDVSFANWCLPQIHDFFRQRKVGSVRIGPYWLFPEAEKLERSLFGMGYQRYEKEHATGRRTTGIVDIRGNDEELLKSFKQSTRYEIKHARKLGVEIRSAVSVEEAMEFFNHLDQRDKERGIGRTSRVEALAISAFLISETETGAIISAYREDSFLGGLMVARGGETAFTVKFVVSEHCKRLFPTLRIAPSIFFTGMLWAKSRGCEYVDLEGYTANNYKQADKVFVNRYKAGFCPVECQSLGQYFMVCDQLMHRLQQLAGVGVRVTRLPHRLAHRVSFALKKRSIENRPHQDERTPK